MKWHFCFNFPPKSFIQDIGQKYFLIFWASTTTASDIVLFQNEYDFLSPSLTLIGKIIRKI